MAHAQEHLGGSKADSWPRPERNDFGREELARLNRMLIVIRLQGLTDAELEAEIQRRKDEAK